MREAAAGTAARLAQGDSARALGCATRVLCINSVCSHTGQPAAQSMQEHSPTCSLHARGQVRSTAQTRDSPILSPRKKVGGIWVFWQAHLFIEGMADSY